MSATRGDARRWTRPRRGGWTLGDLALSLAVLALLVVEVVSSAEAEPKLALAATALVVALPVSWRTCCPGPAAAAVAAGYLASSVISQGPFPPQLSVLPLVALVFHAATRLRDREAWMWGGLTLLLTVAGHVSTNDGDVTDFWPWLLWGVAWFTGVAVRRRTDSAAEHAARAAVLEAEQEAAEQAGASRERDRIARELHDVVAHAVSVMVVQAGAERLRLGAGAEPTRGVLFAIEESGRQALGELRTMLGVLRESDDESYGLGPLPGFRELPALVDNLRGAGLEVDLVLDPDLVADGAEHVPTAVELATYRIVQESLTNVVRHAGRVRTHVQVTRAADALEVHVVNEGGQSVAANVGTGSGVIGMAERVAAVGGQLEAGPCRDGYRVHAVLPLSVQPLGRR